MTSDMTKLLKHVDGDLWRQFRAYCVGAGITMGPAISSLMLGVLKGRIDLNDADGVSGKSKTGSWQWPDDRKDVLK